jgi:hypothetical protein
MSQEIIITIGKKTLSGVWSKWAEGSALIITDQHPQGQYKAAKVGRMLFWDPRSGKMQHFHPEQENAG